LVALFRTVTAYIPCRLLRVRISP